MKLSKVAKHWNKTRKNTTYVKGGNDFSGFLRFDTGEPWFPLTPMLKLTLEKLAVEDLKHRPDIQCKKLKSAASSFWNVPQENIAVSNGSDQFIWLLPRLFMNINDIAITIEPTFFLFSEAVRRAGGKTVSIPTDKLNGFQITNQIVKGLLKTAKKRSAKLIWLCNPNNPTGTTIPLTMIKRIAQSTDALLIVDEAFFDLSELHSEESALNLIKNHKNIVVIKTLSKTFGLGSTRVGFAFAQEEIINVLENWRLPFEISGIAQKIACEILNDKKHWIEMKKQLLNERKWFINKLSKFKDLELSTSTKTNIFLVRHTSKNLLKALIAKKILAADFNMCKGIKNMGFARLSVLDRKRNEQLINAIKNID